MAQSLSDEEFGRMQAQLIDLRTTNYELESKCKGLQTEYAHLQEKVLNQEKELLKATKAINKSKNRKEFAVLLEENENLQRQFQSQEENFKLQNLTLLQEISKLNEENEQLQRAIKKGDNVDSSNDAEVRRLKAENAVLQKRLTSTQENFDTELSELRGRLKSVGEASVVQELHGSSERDQNEENNPESHAISKGVINRDFYIETQNIKTVDQLSNILNDELKTFCERISSNQNTLSERNFEQVESDQKVLENEADENPEEDREDSGSVKTDRMSVSNLMNEETEGLKTRLIEVLQPFVSSVSNNASQSKAPEHSRSEIEEIETRNVSLEQQIKELSGLQLQLDTEREEKRLLQEQLNKAETNSKNEISRLEHELSKWMDKAKKKQESYLQLQEEKENLYAEKNKAVEDIKSSKDRELKQLTLQLANMQEELVIANQRFLDCQTDANKSIRELQETIANQQTQASSNAEEQEQLFSKLRQEHQSVSEEFEKMKEKCRVCTEEQEETEELVSQLENKVKDYEQRNSELNLQVEELHAQIKEQTTAGELWTEQIGKLTTERDQLDTSLQETTKVAEKRKTMIDEMAIERQRSDDNHKEQIEKMVEEHKKVVNDLKEQLTGEKKLRKEVEELQHKAGELKTKLHSVENKSGWFERRLNETEEQLKSEKEQNEKNVKELGEKHQQELKDQQEEHNAEIEGHKARELVLLEEKEEQDRLLAKLQQDLKDKEVENRIAGKKGDQLVKDLKRQLKLERKRSEQLQQRLQEALSESRAKQSFDELFGSPDRQRRNSGDSSVLSQPLFNRSDMESPDARPPSPTASITTILNDETVDLIERLADVQQEKWLLEERVKHLEQTGAAFAEDLMQKSSIIQAYAMEPKCSPVAESPKPKSSPGALLKEKMKTTFMVKKSDGLEHKRMQLMVEETLMKNVQLQNDIDRLSKELEKYQQGETKLATNGEVIGNKGTIDENTDSIQEDSPSLEASSNLDK